MALANQLVRQLSVKRFASNEFVDEFEARVQGAGQRKVEGKEASAAQAPVTSLLMRSAESAAALPPGHAFIRLLPRRLRIWTHLGMTRILFSVE
jgi:hypothetical protein